MGISLTLFLNINLLLMVMFPYGRMFAHQGEKRIENYSKSVCVSTSFALTYLLICIPDFFENLCNVPELGLLKWIIVSSGLSLGLEIAIFLVIYKKIRICTIRQGSLFQILMMLVAIPVIEEILYVLCLHTICMTLHLGRIVFVILSAAAFGVGHFIHHKINILTKTVWGIIFAIIFLYTGNIYIVIFSHMINNVILFFLGKSKWFRD